jgi:hypothetical protein
MELLVVVGLIALLMGGIGFALRDSGPNIALQNAQGLLVGALSAARSQAMSSQANACLAINADPSSDRFLRSLHILIDSGGGRWRTVGSEIKLPDGAFVVPAVATPAAQFQSVLGEHWPAERVSLLDATAGNSSRDDSGDAPIGQLENVVLTRFVFTARGIPFVRDMRPEDVPCILVAPARRTPEGLIFDNPEMIRGVRLSNYGTPLLVNNPAELTPR